MKRVFLSKSNFFIIDYEEGDYEFSLNQGNTNEIGEYRIYDFDSKETCEKEAYALMDKILSKGFVECRNFNFDNHVFVDDFDFGAHRKTSHPNFINHFTDDLYFQIYDEETPFGSDEGHDTLAILTDRFVEDPNLIFYEFPKILATEIWGIDYVPVKSLEVDDIKETMEINEDGMIQSDIITYATAFSQIKLTGSLDERLKVDALNSLKRYSIYLDLNDYPKSYTLEKMIEDLEAFNTSC